MADIPTVILDTNVLDAALRSKRGASFALLSLLGEGRFEIAISVPLVLEYEDVLLRHTEDTGHSPAQVAALLDYVCTVGQRQAIFFLWRPLLPDARDDMVLEAAVSASCNAIVTHNRRHFGAAKQFGIRVVSPAEFLREIGGAR